MTKLLIRAASFGRRKSSNPKASEARAAAAVEAADGRQKAGGTDTPVEPPELKIATHSITLNLQRSSAEARLGLGVLDNCMVKQVDEAGAGAAAGFSPGDWVVSIAGVAVTSYDEMVPLLRTISTTAPTPVVVRYSPTHHPDRVAPFPTGAAGWPDGGWAASWRVPKPEPVGEPEEAANDGDIGDDGAQAESDGAKTTEAAAAATSDKSALAVTTAGHDDDERHGTTEAVQVEPLSRPGDRDASPGTLMRLQAQRVRTVEDSILSTPSQSSPTTTAAAAADADAQGGKRLTATGRVSSFGRKRGDSRNGGSAPAPAAVKLTRSTSFGRKESAATKLTRSISFGRKASSSSAPTLAGHESAAASVQPTGKIEFESWLFKQTKTKAAFQKRFCFLQGGVLCYKDPKVADHAIVCGQVTAVDITSWERYEIAIFADGHEYNMRAATKAEIEGWFSACQAAAKRWLATQQ